MADFWKPTSDMFSGLIEKPKMTQKLLSKPPFKYIFDIIIETSKKTNFARNLYPGQQTNGDYYKDRDTKILFLNKIIQLVEMMNGSSIQAKAQKIVAGLQPENTNILLQEIYKCASSGKNSDPFVAKVLGGGGNAVEQEQQDTKKKEPQKKKIQRPPSAAKLKKPAEQVPSKKNVQPQEPVQQVKEVKKVIQKPKKQQYSKKVQQLMEQGEQEAAKEKANEKKQQEEAAGQGKNKLGNLRKKKKGDKVTQKIITTAGQLNEKQLQMLQTMIQSICQNTAPLGKSIEFINDDVDAMNKQLQFWRRQYNASKTKTQGQLKVSEQSLLPVYDKIAEIQDQIKDQKAKIQNAKAQIIKNDSTIKGLLLSVVSTK